MPKKGLKPNKSGKQPANFLHHLTPFSEKYLTIIRMDHGQQDAVAENPAGIEDQRVLLIRCESGQFRNVKRLCESLEHFTQPPKVYGERLSEKQVQKRLNSTAYSAALYPPLIALCDPLKDRIYQVSSIYEELEREGKIDISLKNNVVKELRQLLDHKLIKAIKDPSFLNMACFELNSKEDCQEAERQLSRIEQTLTKTKNAVREALSGAERGKLESVNKALAESRLPQMIEIKTLPAGAGYQVDPQTGALTAMQPLPAKKPALHVDRMNTEDQHYVAIFLNPKGYQNLAEHIDISNGKSPKPTLREFIAGIEDNRSKSAVRAA